MDIIYCEQGTPEWYQARLGRVTASKIADVMAQGRSGKPSATRKNYLAQLVAERLTGNLSESFKSADMEWGTQHEAEARKLYEFYKDVDVKQVGIVYHPTIKMFGASVDGFVGEDGLVEFKCPKTATHIDTLLGKTILGTYKKQMNGQKACTGRAWCDFVSYDPRLPAEMSLHIERVYRDPKAIVETEEAVVEFLNDVDEMESSLREKFMQEAA